MKVVIEGKNFTKKQKSYLIDLAQWTADKLMDGRLSRHITVKIKLMGDGFYIKDSLYALTEVDDSINVNSKKPRHFIITMTTKFSTIRSLIILAHEMVHVKQFAVGELGWNKKKGIEIWKGKALPDQGEYWDFPYEIEAHGREKGLVYQWCDHNKLWNEPWYREVF